jgi:hypothetical protein
MTEIIPNIPQPGVVWYRVEVVTTHPHGEPLKRTVEGDDTWVAASLRALADKLDPPKPPRPGLRQPEPGAGSMVRRTPGGLVALPPPSDVSRRDPMSIQ